MRSSPVCRLTGTLPLALATTACAGARPLNVAAPQTAYADTIHIPAPRARGFSEIADMIERAVVEPVERFLSPGRRVKRASSAGKEARNLNAWDDVENSSWFEHRNGPRTLTLEEIRRGPAANTPPAPVGSLTIVAPKSSGVTPGFRVRDASGAQYMLKFDPLDAPELASAAEAIATRLVYAAGYHTAQTSIYTFDPSRLVISDRARVRDARGRERPMTQADVDSVLRRAARLPGGSVRSLASRWIGGAVGSFDWEGRRADDPNDLIRHQHRRELRGFYVIAAWLNHVDSRRGNTLDQFVGDSAGGYIRHIMLDVSSTLGSGSNRPQTPREGAETTVQYSYVALRALTAGLYRAPWERLDTARASASVGYYDVANFAPGAWMPLRPNPAFEERTARDGYWGAKLVASFTDDHVRAAVAAGEYADPRAADAILQALIQRRDATVRHWFPRVTPIEQPAVRCDGRDLVLSFVDYGVRHGVANAADTRYEVELRHEHAALRRRTTAATLPVRLVDALPPGAFVPWTDQERVARLTVRAVQNGHRQPPATVFLLFEPERGCYRAAGLAH